jgi:hypothetical protein
MSHYQMCISLAVILFHLKIMRWGEPSNRNHYEENEVTSSNKDYRCHSQHMASNTYSNWVNFNNIIYIIGYFIGLLNIAKRIEYRENPTQCSSHMFIVSETCRSTCDSSHESNDMIPGNRRSIKALQLR